MRTRDKNDVNIRLYYSPILHPTELCFLLTCLITYNRQTSSVIRHYVERFVASIKSTTMNNGREALCADGRGEER